MTSYDVRYRKPEEILSDAPSLDFTKNHAIVYAALDYMRDRLKDTHPGLEINIDVAPFGLPAPPTRFELGYEVPITRPILIDRITRRKTRFEPIVNGDSWYNEIKLVIPDEPEFISVCDEISSLSKGKVHFYKTDHYKVAATAVTCVRACAKYTTLPYAAEMRDEVVDESEPGFMNLMHSISPILRKINPDIMAKATILEGRYLATNRAIDLHSDGSILEIAAGLSTRSLEYANGNNPYIETDQKNMIKIKERAVRAIREKEGKDVPANHHFMHLNALELSDFVEMGRFMNESYPANDFAITFSGLLMYMNKAQKRQVRDGVVQLMKTLERPSVLISTDFSYRKTKDNGFVRLAKGIIERHTGFELKPFKDDDEVKSFLSEGGLAFERLPNADLVERLSCVENLGLSMDAARELAPFYEAHVIRLK